MNQGLVSYASIYLFAYYMLPYLQTAYEFQIYQ